PSQAPLAFATLNAEWCSDEASDGAFSAPSSSSRARIGLAVDEAKATPNAQTTAMTGEVTVKNMSSRIEAIEAKEANMPRSGNRSATWPPATLPSAMPVQNTTSVDAIANDPKPVTSDSSGVK